MKNKKATFGAGCFWRVEKSFRKIPGVKKTTVGFMGGDKKMLSYEEVCKSKTGHVEACQIEFDLETISYEKLLEIFWKSHDPTQSNRQGLDIGIQYRSVIFFHDSEQEKLAIRSRDKEQKKLKKKIVTTIEKAKTFYKAEEYHQKYLLKRGLMSCPV